MYTFLVNFDGDVVRTLRLVISWLLVLGSGPRIVDWLVVLCGSVAVVLGSHSELSLGKNSGSGPPSVSVVVYE